MTRTGDVSFWYAELGGLPALRAPLDGDATADVAIVGAGFTGLWTAWYLAEARPDLTVRLVEQAFAGYGASGRNGGWLTGTLPWNRARYAATHGAQGVRDMIAALAGTVPEVVGTARRLGLDAAIHETEELAIATSPAQRARLEAEHAALTGWGEGGRLTMLDAAALRARIAVPGAEAALATAGVARVQPARLVRGLAAAVEARGAVIHEGTRALRLAPGRVETDRGTLRAPIVLRCTEGFTAALPGARRSWLPLNSAQIVTEPLPARVWDEIGWQGAELVGDGAHVYCYCQRTRDGRIAVGSRGVPYRFGSRLDRDGAPEAETVRRLRDILARLFPAARGVGIAHAWCGVLGVPRDWCATVGLDPATGLGWAGGYVGIGLSSANLAGRTLADLALGRETARTGLPWVGRRVRRWEPEPLRWLGVRGMYAALAAADRHEARGGGPSRLAALANRLAGR